MWKLKTISKELFDEISGNPSHPWHKRAIHINHKGLNYYHVKVLVFTHPKIKQL